MVGYITLLLWLVFHPVHVTMTSIDHVPDTDSLKVFMRMYYDDFLRDYKLFDEEVNVEDYVPNKLFPEDLISKYLNEKVHITINNKELTGKLLNVTLADNELSLNLLYRTTKNPEVITVRNMVMTDLYSDMANMTIIRFNNFEEGIKLTSDKPEETFELK
jgi:hypothetical protein